MRTTLLGCCAVLGLIALQVADGRAQQKPPTKEPLIVLQENNKRLPIATKKRIKSVASDNEKVVRVLQPKEPREIMLAGVEPGKARITLTDEDGQVETTEVEVRSNVLVIGIGNTIRLQMTSKRKIKSVINEHDKIIRVGSVANDPTTVTVTGLAAGAATLTLTSEDGETEVFGTGKPEKK